MSINVKDLTERLMKLKERGYIKIAFDESYGFLDILIIHKDWKDYNFSAQFEQAAQDLETVLLPEERHYSLEIPTLEMYQHHRNADAPIQSHVVFDLILSS